MTSGSRFLAVAGAAAFGLVALGWGLPVRSGNRAQSGSAPAASRPSTRTAQPAPLAPYQAELLDLAFGAASAFPTDPHAKNRSRAQDEVVAAWLTVGQPERALACLEKVDDWRRGAAYADLAYYWAQQGEAARAFRFLDAARLDLERAKQANDQEWRQDRVRAKIARTFLCLGLPQRAAEFGSGLVESEAARVSEAEAELLAEPSFAARVAAAEAAIQKGGFEATRSALAVCLRLHERFYGDPERRERLEADVRKGRKHMAIGAYLDALASLARSAARQGDLDHALEIVAECEQVAASVRWVPRDSVALASRFATLRAEAGAKDAARLAADRALGLYEASQDKIVDVERASALRPIAEAYLAAGAYDAALSVFRKAADAGAQNPNARPRADDLVATCCLLAMRRVEPDSALWSRLRQIRAGLTPPW